MDIGNRIFSVEEVGSTNELAQQLIKNKEIGNGDVVITEFQGKGKGQTGSVWESNKGENLLFSIVLKPEMMLVEHHFYLSKFITLAVCRFIKKYISATYIKWPNDIICDGKKICGVLIENVLERTNIKTSVIGVGLNINQIVFIGDYKATSLSIETGGLFQLNLLFQELLNYINKEYNKLANGMYEEMDRDYLNFLFRYQEWAAYTEKGQLFQGKITGIGNMGELKVLKQSGEEKHYGFKEVVFCL